MSPENCLLSGTLSEKLREEQSSKKNTRNKLDELEPQITVKRRKPRGPPCGSLALQQVSGKPSQNGELASFSPWTINIKQQRAMNCNCSRQASKRTFANQRGGSLTLIGLLVAAALLSALAANAEHAQPDQEAAGYAGNQRADNYANQQVAQPQSKGKKIQIVYIKVPLAKLKTSLPASNGNDNYAGSSADNTTNYGNQHDATEQTKLQGSQSAADQQQQIALDSADSQQQVEQLPAKQQQHGTFLIPMALIQTQAESSAGSFPAQPQQHELANEAGRSLSTASSYHAIHSQPADAAHSGAGRRSRHQQSPMQHYQQMLMSSASVNHGINHGFMSNFLLAEKEKMAAAAMRQMQQVTAHANQVPATAAATQSGSAALALNSPAQGATLPANANSDQTLSGSLAEPLRPAVAPSNNPPTNNQQNHQAANHQKQGPGGLMPVMMMPFSMMPDNAIGQAYNAAVGQALPIESGSPANILSSPSTLHADTGKQQQQRANGNGNNNYGGNAGTGGDSNTLHGTQSSATYGSNGQNQPETSSLGNGYQHSASGSGVSGPSSGYGSGINSFGASVAFSDYPIGPSTGSGQQTYAHSSSNSNSNSNNNNYDSSNRHHSQYEQQQQAGSVLSQAENYTNQKLRQAKKTIIPIVVQVEHAIMENNGAGLVNNYNNQQQQQQQQPRGNKYSGGRGYRQLGGKRGNRNNEGYRNAANGLYGSSSNEILNLGGSDAQYINAANAQDINKITAAINAENAASAAAALAQADMAFGRGAPAYIPSQGGRGNQQQQQAGPGQQRPHSQYLQSAASALLANTHPVIQAAASGGLASVSKLGAKLGEMIALPSMQVPGSISSIGSALPSALSSLTSQMGVQLNQAVQQVAKEHPTAHAFARQVAQHAGLNLANFNNLSPQQQALFSQQQQQQQQQVSNGNQQQQPQASASNQHAQSLSPQAQLQNLRLSIGQNLQTAAAQLIGVHTKSNAQSAASLLSSPLAALYPQSMNAALKQLSGAASGMQMSGSALSPFAQLASGANLPNEPQHAQPSSLVPVQQQQQQQQLGNNNNIQAALMQQFQSGNQHQLGDSHQAGQSAASSAQSSLLSSLETQSAGSAGKPGKSSLRSKFLSFFQPPKFISNLLSWNDRADERADQGELSSVEPATSGKQAEKSDKLEEKLQQKPLVAAARQNETVKAAAAKNESSVPETTSSTRAAPVALTTSNATTLVDKTTKAEATATSLAPALNPSSSAPKKAN